MKNQNSAQNKVKSKNPEVVYMTEAEIVEMFRDAEKSGVLGASFVGLDTLTIPTLKGGKSNPMQGEVAKFNEGSSVMVFQNKNSNGYENMVMKRLIAEGKNPESFELGKRAWGTRIEGTPLIEHKGEYYLEVIFLKSGVVSYYHEGKEIHKNEVIGLEDKEEGHQGGLDNKVIIRTFKIASLISVRINSKVIIVLR
jgi:hypothetical protein